MTPSGEGERVNCPDEYDLIAAAKRGGDRTDNDRVTAHLTDCAECSSLIAELLRGEGEPPSPAASARAESVAPDSLAAGTLVGRFVILGWIGRGAMGEVLSALAGTLLLENQPIEALPLARAGVAAVAAREFAGGFRRATAQLVLAKTLYACGHYAEALALAGEASAAATAVAPGEKRKIEAWLASLPPASPRSRVRVKSQLLHHGAQRSVGDAR